MALQGFLCARRAQPLRENVHPGPFFGTLHFRYGF